MLQVCDLWCFDFVSIHYCDAIMGTIASQITSLTIVYTTVYSDADQSKHQSSASLAFVWGIHRDRWIPRTKGQLRGKCFHLMTSSCGPLYLRCQDYGTGIAENYTITSVSTRPLTHWGRETHIYVSKLTDIGSNNGLSPDRRQAIIGINTRILVIRTIGTNFSDILSEIYTFSFKKMHVKMSSAKCC